MINLLSTRWQLSNPVFSKWCRQSHWVFSIRARSPHSSTLIAHSLSSGSTKMPFAGSSASAARFECGTQCRRPHSWRRTYSTCFQPPRVQATEKQFPAATTFTSDWSRAGAVSHGAYSRWAVSDTFQTPASFLGRSALISHAATEVSSASCRC